MISIVDPEQMKGLAPEQVKLARARIGMNTGIWFYAGDIDAAYRELKSRQVDVTKPERQVWGGMMSNIRDQDGNCIGLVGDPRD